MTEVDRIKKAREDERKETIESIGGWVKSHEIDWEGIPVVRVDFLLEILGKINRAKEFRV